jgi:hypothetical protein
MGLFPSFKLAVAAVLVAVRVVDSIGGSSQAKTNSPAAVAGGIRSGMVPKGF